MDIKQYVQSAASQALKATYELDYPPEDIQVQRTNKDHTGHFTVIVFPFLRHKLGKPEAVGARLGEYLQANDPAVKEFNVVKGFLNIRFSASFLRQQLFAMATAGEAFFSSELGKGKTSMVEYSSPNTNKPLHLGHLRNNFLGYAISQLLEGCGYRVVKANLLNDRGIHICQSMLAYQQFGNGETPQEVDAKGDHLVGDYYVEFGQRYRKQVNELMEAGATEETARKDAPLMQAAAEMHRKWEQGDPEVRALWEKMNSWVIDGFNATYNKIGVAFDKYYFESDTYLLGKQIVAEGLEKGVFYKEEDGSVWVDLQDYNLDKKLLLRSDGTSVYITQDLGTAQLKFDDYPLDESLYVIGNEQDHHMKVLRATLDKLGRPWANAILHISYGMVELPTGKMKTREGTVVDADELVAEMERIAAEQTAEKGLTEGFSEQELTSLYETLALGALKYYLLKVDPVKSILFNPEESISFEGHTGVYIQYNHARICAVLRLAEEQGLWHPEAPLQEGQLPPQAAEDLADSETEVLLLLSQCNEFLEKAAAEYNPAHLANYVYELTRAFSKFYAEVKILTQADDPNLVPRLTLLRTLRDALAKGMGYLGIAVPQRM